MGKPRVFRSKEYKAWFKGLTEKEKGIVDTRIGAYISQGKLVKIKPLDPSCALFEFKWDSGLRVYFSFLEDSEGNLMLLLLGGNKNSQAKDITEAKNIVIKATAGIAAKNKKPVKKATKKTTKKKR